MLISQHFQENSESDNDNECNSQEETDEDNDEKELRDERNEGKLIGIKMKLLQLMSFYALRERKLKHKTLRAMIMVWRKETECVERRNEPLLLFRMTEMQY